MIILFGSLKKRNKVKKLSKANYSQVLILILKVVRQRKKYSTLSRRFHIFSPLYLKKMKKSQIWYQNCLNFSQVFRAESKGKDKKWSWKRKLPLKIVMKRCLKPWNSVKVELMKYKGQDLNMPSKWNLNLLRWEKLTNSRYLCWDKNIEKLKNYSKKGQVELRISLK